MLGLNMWKFTTLGIALAVAAMVGIGALGIATHPGVFGPATHFTVASTVRTQVYFLVNSLGSFPGAPTAILAIGGSGTFQGSGASITGIFTVFNGSLGPTNAIASGSWRATSLVGFNSYGFFSPRVEGGNLTLTVKMDFDSGATVTGVTLLVNCHIAQPATVTLSEGVYVTGPGFSFSPITPSTPLNGITVFSLPPPNTANALSTLALIAAVRQSSGACNLGCC